LIRNNTTRITGVRVFLAALVFPLMCNAADPAFWGGTVSVESLKGVPESIITRMENDGIAEFFIVLADQADLSGAAQLARKEDRGMFVFNQLRAVADRTQPQVIADLGLHRSDIRRFHIQNMILVKDGSPDMLLGAVNHVMVSAIRENRPYEFTNEQPMAYEANEPARAPEWNLVHIGITDVWSEGITGEGIVVANLDTGVDWDHPALKNKYRGWNGSAADHDYNWHDVSSSPSSVPYDSGSHGTHTMGTMVGDDGAGNQVGGAPGAKWIACGPLTDDAGFHECFEWFLAPYRFGENPSQGVPEKAPHVVNNSWGWPVGGGDYQYAPDIDALQAAGVFMEFSAGNEGDSCESLRSPGDYPQVLSTGASDVEDRIVSTTWTYWGSSRGPASSGIPGAPDFIKPEIVAPGYDVRSCVPGTGYEGGWGGTSMAGPHTCAVVALMWSAAPGLIGDIATTRQIIIDGAYTQIGGAGYWNQTCEGINAATTIPNHVWGWGLLDAYACFQALAGVYLDRPVYQPDDTMIITVRDMAATGSVDIQVQSTVETSWEYVTLPQVGDGEFETSFNTTSGPPVHGDGAISVTHGATITVWYPDLDSEAIASVDGEPPVISNVSVTNIGAVSFIVNWETSEPADTVLHYGTMIPPSNTITLTQLTLSHQVILTDLNSNTDYFFMIQSTDAAGNTAEDDNGGMYYYVRTLNLLWNQPVSASSPGRVANQEFPDYPTYTSFVADDFVNEDTWYIEQIFVPGELYNGGTSLMNATQLHWRIYADDNGWPAGDPSGGGSAPYWSLDLSPGDALITLLDGFSDTDLTLDTPLELPPGTWWLIFYPTMSFSPHGQMGRLSSDTSNLEIGKFINPGNGFGHGTGWQNWSVMGPTQHDVAFRLSGSIEGMATPTPTPAPPTPTPTPDCIHNGDVTFDGIVTAADAQMAFQIALGMIIPTYEEECAADCNGNGAVTAGDAQQIFLTALGADTCVDPL
jgi:subtilisin family serine protease